MWPNSERDLLNAKGCRIWIPLTIENFAFSRVRAEKLKEEGGELEAGVRTALDDEDAWDRSGHLTFFSLLSETSKTSEVLQTPAAT